MPIQSLWPRKDSAVFPSKLMSWPADQESEAVGPVTKVIGVAPTGIGLPSQSCFAGLPMGLPLESNNTGHGTNQLVLK